MMNSITRKTPVLWFALCCLGMSAQAASGLTPWVLKADSLLLSSGTTYRYTVDTPEGEGLVSTLPSVTELVELFSKSEKAVCRVTDLHGNIKVDRTPLEGDRMELVSPQGKVSRRWMIGIRNAALPAQLLLHREQATINAPGNIVLDFRAGQRSPMVKVEIRVPVGIVVTLDNTTVNVIGRGEVLLRDLPKQSIGRTGTHYSYNKVGNVALRDEGERGTVIVFSGLDFRPSNGPDLRICFRGVAPVRKGINRFEAIYTTSKPEVLQSPVAVADLEGITTVADLVRTPLRDFTYRPGQEYTYASFSWTPPHNASSVELLQSADGGNTWTTARAEVTPDSRETAANGLEPNRLYAFKLRVTGGQNKGESNTVWFYTGRKDIRDYRVKGDGVADDTEAINEAIINMSRLGDVGHTFFRNCMFFGERIDNVKVVGTGRITGNGNIVTSDKVMNNSPEKRSDKMFSLKLCTNVEIGGWDVKKDMWYDPGKDIPYYIEGDNRLYSDSTMLHIDQGGHFVLLATGTDGIHVHDTYFAKHSTKNARDIYDFMACNDVTVTNIYSKVSSDDIVKPGSDCSLGFTRPARHYMVRNIVGDTNCNLFQIGSETADDIQDLYVDNIYVLGANKAGFSISTNDGGHVKNVYLNSGKTGPIHSRSVMRRTRAPFFISISNRGRVLGADVAPFTFTENGVVRKELLVTNSNIGQVENIVICGVDIEEVYGGSSFRGDRWKAYDGSQSKATPIIAGFKLPDSDVVEGGLTFRLPDGNHTGYINNVQFHDVSLKVKGGHPSEDAKAYPPEIGVGRYNVGDLKIQPAFGFWARHVKGFLLKNCRIAAEQPDGRYAVVMDDVIGGEVESLQVDKGISDKEEVKLIDCEDIRQ